MKNIFHTLVLSIILFSSSKLWATPQIGTINIISGPSIRIPGISVPTVLELTGVGWPVRWIRGGHGASESSVTEAGTYFAEINISTNPTLPKWIQANSITIPALDHSISGTGPNPQDPTAGNTTGLCLSTNANTYITSIVWKRDGVVDGNTASCRTISIPGLYTIGVTYSYGSESTTIVLGLFINASANAPRIQFLDGTSYNPVTPPTLSVTNFSQFSLLQLLFNGNQISLGGSAFHDFVVTGPGTYAIGGVLPNTNGTIVYTPNIIVPKGDIPTPQIQASNGFVLKYESPTNTLSAVPARYNAGYTWYFNDKPIDGATGSSIAISQPGSYSVQACANYPDGSSQCKTSAAVTVTGESLLVNSVTTKTPLVENVTSTTQLDELPIEQVNISSIYADGFVRPLQSVQRAASPLQQDYALHYKYDEMGRESQKLLPITRNATNGAYYYIPTSLKPIKDFYQKGNDKIADTAFPFAETAFEASPLNRVVKQGAPGEEWQLSTTHTKLFAYTTNKASDNVVIWLPSGTGLASTSFYPDGTLSVLEFTDENSKLSREFKNKTGQTLLTEKVIEGGVKLRTYFVFDDLGRLTHVIPPKTVAALPSTNPVLTFDVLVRECFFYSYDERSRVTVKNTPGAGATYMVYDQWDRVVLTQHANQRTKSKWAFNKFDVLNRVVMSGEIVLAGDNVAATQAVATFYATVATNPTLRYEDVNTNNSFHRYTNRSYPVLANQFQVYTATYYDNYSLLAQFGTAYNFTPESSLGLAARSIRTNGLMTAVKIAILGSPTHVYLKTVNYYDDKHRLIQVKSDNHLNGIDRSSNALDFVGKITKVKMVHNGLQVVTVEEEHTYDPQGRKQKVFHTINGGPKVLLCDYHYNELGQLIEKNIHSTDGTTFLQSLDYAYNIRGWLSQVNPTETEPNATYQDQYGFELAYTTSPGAGITDFQPTFNGNIAAFTEVRPATTDAVGTFKNAYSYQYDARDQLTKATYYQASNPSKNGAFDMPIITYDPNGNILSLKRKGITASSTIGLIDDLNYFYTGNQLNKVDDLADKLKGFIDK